MGSTMFAVVEFDKHELCVVPLVWLCNQEKQCLWPPKIKNQRDLKDMVKKCILPATETWKLYDVRKLFCTGENYENMEARMSIILEENTSDGSSGKDSLRRLEIDELNIESNIDNVDNRGADTPHDDVTCFDNLNALSDDSEISDSSEILKQSYTPKAILRSTSQESDFDDDNNCETEIELERPKEKNVKQKSKIHSDEIRNNSQLPKMLVSDDRRNPTVQNGKGAKKKVVSCLVKKHHPTGQSTWSKEDRSDVSSSLGTTSTGEKAYELILQKLEKIIAVQDQQAIQINEIQRSLQMQNFQSLTRPSDLPTYPLQTCKDFMRSEELLEKEDNWNYLRARLAAVGGTSVRNMVMNMLKFSITNKVAMKFNWAGREKAAFKNTKLMGVINEAVKLAYKGKVIGESELTDFVIENAVKDWLKLAKHRFEYQKNKQKQ